MFKKYFEGAFFIWSIIALLILLGSISTMLPFLNLKTKVIFTIIIAIICLMLGNKFERELIKTYKKSILSLDLLYVFSVYRFFFFLILIYRKVVGYDNPLNVSRTIEGLMMGIQNYSFLLISLFALLLIRIFNYRRVYLGDQKKKWAAIIFDNKHLYIYTMLSQIIFLVAFNYLNR